MDVIPVNEPLWSFGNCRIMQIGEADYNEDYGYYSLLQ